MPETSVLAWIAGPARLASLAPPRRARAMCAGVVPQQPPTMLSQPSSMKRASMLARSLSGVSGYVPSASGRPAFG